MSDPWKDVREEVEGVTGMVGGIFFSEDYVVDADVAKRLLADADALLERVRILDRILERLAVWFEKTSEDELAASVELPPPEKIGAYLRQRLWEEAVAALPEYLWRAVQEEQDE